MKNSKFDGFDIDQKLKIKEIKQKQNNKEADSSDEEGLE
jgi:hypothetical protein